MCLATIRHRHRCRRCCVCHCCAPLTGVFTVAVAIGCEQVCVSRRAIVSVCVYIERVCVRPSAEGGERYCRACTQINLISQSINARTCQRQQGGFLAVMFARSSRGWGLVALCTHSCTVFGEYCTKHRHACINRACTSAGTCNYT